MSSLDLRGKKPSSCKASKHPNLLPGEVGAHQGVLSVGRDLRSVGWDTATFQAFLKIFSQAHVTLSRDPLKFWTRDWQEMLTGLLVALEGFAEPIFWHGQKKGMLGRQDQTPEKGGWESFTLLGSAAPPLGGPV